MRAFFKILITVVCLVAFPLFAQEPAAVTPLGALWRSALLPGWGQFAQGRPLAGATYAGLMGLGGVTAVIQRDELKYAQRDYGKYASPYSVGGLLALSQGANNVLANPVALANPTTAFLYNRGFEARRRAIAFKNKKLNLTYNLLGVVYALNLADSYFLTSPATPDKSVSARSAAWRSALLPGWGQYSQGREGATYLYGGGAITLFAWVGSQRIEHEKNKDAYRVARENLILSAPFTISALTGGATSVAVEASIPYLAGVAQALSRKNRSKARYEGSIYAFGVFYAWNIADVFLFDPSSRAAFLLGPKSDGLALQFQWRY